MALLEAIRHSPHHLIRMNNHMLITDYEKSRSTRNISSRTAFFFLNTRNTWSPSQPPFSRTRDEIKWDYAYFLLNTKSSNEHRDYEIKNRLTTGDLEMRLGRKEPYNNQTKHAVLPRSDQWHRVMFVHRTEHAKRRMEQVPYRDPRD